MRLFTKEEMMQDAEESDLLRRAAEKARAKPIAADRAKQEQEAWSVLSGKVVGAER